MYYTIKIIKIDEIIICSLVYKTFVFVVFTLAGFKVSNSISVIKYMEPNKKKTLYLLT